MGRTDKFIDFDQSPPEAQSDGMLDAEIKQQERDKVLREIEKRETFSYKYGRFWIQWRFDKWYCFCCKPKRKRDDILFQDAKKKLSEEIDILEIVKKLRVHQFASQIILKPHQLDLVNFFRDYKIFDEA